MTLACAECDCIVEVEVEGPFCGECSHRVDAHERRDDGGAMAVTALIERVVCSRDDCDCAERYGPDESRRFCRECGHACAEHGVLNAGDDAEETVVAMPIQADDVDEPSAGARRSGRLKPGAGACEACTCATFAGASGAKFCNECGHARASHVVALPVLADAAVDGAADASSLAGLRSFPPAAIASVFVLAVVICTGTFFAGRAIASGSQSKLEHAQDEDVALTSKIDDVEERIEDERRAMREAQAAGAAAQRTQKNAATRRAALQKEIGALRTRQQGLRGTLASADAYIAEAGGE